MRRQVFSRKVVLYVFAAALLFCAAGVSFARTDAMDGPVVQDAKLSLEKGDVASALKWVKKDFEAEVKQAFDNAISSRAKGDQEKNKAELIFFETLVRLHLQGEGQGFTGIKPAGADVDFAVTGGDRALENGSVDSLVQLLNEEVNKGVRERFNNAFEKKKHAEESVDAGRAYVEAYMDFMRYVDGLYLEAQGKPRPQADVEKAEAEHKQ